MFGRPDLIIQQQTALIERLPMPTEHKLATLIDFGMAVQNLVTIMQTANLQSYLDDPTTREWAHYSRAVLVNLFPSPNPNLKEKIAEPPSTFSPGSVLSSMAAQTNPEARSGLYPSDASLKYKGSPFTVPEEQPRMEGTSPCDWGIINPPGYSM